MLYTLVIVLVCAFQCTLAVRSSLRQSRVAYFLWLPGIALIAGGWYLLLFLSMVSTESFIAALLLVPALVVFLGACYAVFHTHPQSDGNRFLYFVGGLSTWVAAWGVFILSAHFLPDQLVNSPLSDSLWHYVAYLGEYKISERHVRIAFGLGVSADQFSPTYEERWTYRTRSPVIGLLLGQFEHSVASAEPPISGLRGNCTRVSELEFPERRCNVEAQLFLGTQKAAFHDLTLAQNIKDRVQLNYSPKADPSQVQEDYRDLLEKLQMFRFVERGTGKDVGWSPERQIDIRYRDEYAFDFIQCKAQVVAGVSAVRFDPKHTYVTVTLDRRPNFIQKCD